MPALIEALECIDEDFRGQVISILDAIGPVTIPILADALKHENRLIRCGASDALGKMGPAARKAAPALRAALHDDIDAVHDTAKEALKKIQQLGSP